jgi:ketopantoate reductase
MGAGNIVIGMLYRRIVECGQNPVVALSNVYGVELDSKTLKYARERIYKFMMAVEKNLNLKFTDEEWKRIRAIIFEGDGKKYPNFVESDIFKWNLDEWCPESESQGAFGDFFE